MEIPQRPTQAPASRWTRGVIVAALVLGALVTSPSAVAAPPPNDDFGGAVVIGALPFNHSVNTTAATTATDDPSCGSLGNGKSVWYRYTATGNTTIEIDTNGSDYDTVIGVFRGTRGNLSSFGCSSDPVGGSVTRVRVTVPSGTTLHIMVSTSTSGTGGNLSFHVRASQPAVVLDLRVNGTAAILSGGSRAVVAGTALLSRPIPGPAVLCIQVHLTQRSWFFPAVGIASRCFSFVENRTSMPWSVDVRAVGGLWRAGYASAFATGTLIANQTAADTTARTVLLRAG